MSSSSGDFIPVSFVYELDPSQTVPMTVHFRDTTEWAYPIINRLWEFGDGEESLAINPIHVYYEEKVYTVTLTLEDNIGGFGERVEHITIEPQTLAPAVIPRLNYLGNDVSVQVIPYNYKEEEELTEGLVGGVLHLVHIENSGNETTLGIITFDESSIAFDGSLALKFLNVAYTENLVIDFTVLTNPNTFTGRVTVLTETDETLKDGVLIPSQDMEEIDKKPEPRQDYVVTPTLGNTIEVDFTSADRIVYTGTGVLKYLGGGNRLMQNIDGILVFQGVDENPVESELSAYCELIAYNLIANNDFYDINSSTGLPTGYSVECTEDVSLAPKMTTTDTIPTVQILNISASGASTFNSPVTFSTPVSSITSITDFLFSCFLGISPSGNSNLIDVTFKLVFLDAADATVYVEEYEYTPQTFLRTITVGSVTALRANVPATATQVRGEIVFNGFSKGDRFVFKFGIPQVTTIPVVSSYIIGVNERKADKYYIEGQTIDYRSGILEIAYVSEVLDIDTTLIDTTSADEDGLRLRVLADGYIEFTINSGGTDYTIVTEAQDFSSVTERTIRVEWRNLASSTDERKIFLNNTLLLKNTDSFAVPTENSNIIYVGSNSDGEEQLSGQLETLNIIS